MNTPAEFCDAIGICGVVLRAIPWGRVGVLIAAIVFAYGVAMSIAFFLYVYRSRGERTPRRTSNRAWKA